MQTIELSAGTIEYEDTGGSGPVVVLLHGSLWRHVVRELRSDHRCLVPTLPLGSHRRPMRVDTDLSPHGIAKLQAEFLEALDLREVTLVGNDLGAFQLTAGWYPERITRLVLTPCEAFENFPPGLPGRTAEVGIKLPGGALLMAQLLRVHALRRLPLTFGRMVKRPIPIQMVDVWLRPLQTQRGGAPRSHQVRAHRRQGGHARHSRAPALLRPSGARHLGEGGPRHAAFARAAICRAAPTRATDRDRRQLHPHPT